jgi:hypothetical protein
MTRCDLIDRDNLWSFYSCWVTEVNCENKHAILHLGVDVGRLAGIRDSNIRRTADKPRYAVGHVTDGENLQIFAHASFAPVLQGRVLQMGDWYALQQLSVSHGYMAQLRVSR